MRVVTEVKTPLTLYQFWIFIQNDIGTMPNTLSLILFRHALSRKGRGRFILTGVALSKSSATPAATPRNDRLK